MARVFPSSLLLVALAITAASIQTFSVVSGFSSTSNGNANARQSITASASASTSTSTSTFTTIKSSNTRLESSVKSIETSPDIEFTTYDGRKPTEDWEIDCYSRPVVTEGGKKLWEVLITDSTGSFRFCKTLPSNKVNSKELRQTVEDLMEDPNIDTKPSTIRFFRGAMFNMINIALSELDVTGRPSRCTNSIAQWLEERHKDVYPNMEGYRATMGVSGSFASGGPSFLNVRTPVKMPDALRGEKYAFVALPLAEMLPGGSITSDNIGVGSMCTISESLAGDLPPADCFVQGIVILTQRPDALSQWLAGTELASMSCDLRKRNLIMETDIDTRFLMAKLNDEQREEGVAFEEGKDALNGLHFVCVQRDEDDDPAGFWLMRELPTGI